MNRFVSSLAASAALLAASLVPAHAELDVASLKKAIETSLASDYPKLDALYKELHAHPELAFQEVKTAARLAAEMRALGFDVTENVGMTGLVAIYKNGDGPTIMRIMGARRFPLKTACRNTPISPQSLAGPGRSCRIRSSS